ncbi:MAG: hypothetical protein D6729_03575 [Deltaproteobacteria bacterium]|nr:MAG: hypothetical protein D6729_03575 [Deltaproteobacteria bacterium]
MRLLLTGALLLGLTAACGPAPPDTPDGGDAGAAPVTWYGDVLPVLEAHCLGCHRVGGASFPLGTYEEAAPLATTLADAAQSGRMPPWPPSEACEPLAHARTMSRAERATLRAWIRDGLQRGDPSTTQLAPPPPPGLPRTDLVLDPGVEYTPNPTEGDDDYRCFVVEPGLAQDRDMIGLEVVPGQPGLVHHLLAFQADPALAREADDAEAGPGWTCFGGPGTKAGVLSTPEVIAAWAPGGSAVTLPDGTGITLRAGKVVVLQVHYNLEFAPPAPDRTVVKVMLSEERVPRPAIFAPIADLGLYIPAGATGREAGAVRTTNGEARIHGLFPHMHLLGRKIRVDLRPRDGSPRCLIDIPEWDFNWQGMYFFADPSGIRVVPPDEVVLTCTYDNPGPDPVTWGDGSRDEMCLAYVYVTGTF